MKEFKWLFNTPIAHRGLHDETKAENSMSAYKAAIEKGYSIEIDVHPSSDGKVIVFHDYTLNRVCGIDGLTMNVDSNELCKYKLGKTEDCIPMLTDLLKLIDGKVGLLIEIKYKNNKAYKNLCPELYKLIKDYKGNVAIQSFSPLVVNWFKKNAPEITRGLLATAYGELKTAEIVKKAMRVANRLFGRRVIKIIKPDFIAYNIMSFPSPTMKKIRETGMPFLTWTVRNAENLALAKECADNIIFEKTDISSYKK